MAQLNRTDMHHTAQDRGIICPSDATVEELLGYLNTGVGPPTPFEDPERDLRVVMMGWTEAHWDAILAQHIGELDCIACPMCILASCFIANRSQLQAEGRLHVEDPWLLLMCSTTTRGPS